MLPSEGKSRELFRPGGFPIGAEMKRYLPAAGMVVLACLVALACTVPAVPQNRQWLELLSACAGHTNVPAIPTELSPPSPVLLPRCGEYQPGVKTAQFSLADPAVLEGAWVSSTPVAVAVFNDSYFPIYGWPCPGCLSTSGTLNETLFPGAYWLAVAWAGHVTLIATQPFEANFDMGLEVIQSPENISVPADGIAAWNVSVPGVATQTYLEAPMSTTSCDSLVAILPATTLATVELGKGNNTSIDQGVVIGGGSALPCNAPDSLSLTGTLFIGPLNISPGEDLAFLNLAGFPVELLITDPVEVAYTLPSS